VGRGKKEKGERRKERKCSLPFFFSPVGRRL